MIFEKIGGSAETHHPKFRNTLFTHFVLEVKSLETLGPLLESRLPKTMRLKYLLC